MSENNSILKSIEELFAQMDKNILVVLILILLAIMFRGAARVTLIVALLVYLAAWKLIAGFWKE